VASTFLPAGLWWTEGRSLELRTMREGSDMQHTIGHGLTTQTGVTRRGFLELSAYGLATSLLAACVPATPAASPTTQAAKPAAQPRTGGSLTVGTTLDIDTLDGHRLSGPTANWRFMTYDALVAYDDKAQAQPMLAESWDFSADKKQLKLNLRKGVTFHSGRQRCSWSGPGCGLRLACPVRRHADRPRDRRCRRSGGRSPPPAPRVRSACPGRPVIARA
jgi:hypothetical protein